jgi:hypothetical protein
MHRVRGDNAERVQCHQERHRMRLAKLPADLVADHDDVEGTGQPEGGDLGPLNVRAPSVTHPAGTTSWSRRRASYRLFCGSLRSATLAYIIV